MSKKSFWQLWNGFVWGIWNKKNRVGAGVLMHFTSVTSPIVAITRCRTLWNESGWQLELTQEQCECVSMMLSWSKRAAVKDSLLGLRTQLTACGQGGTACLSMFQDVTLVLLKIFTENDLGRVPLFRWQEHRVGKRKAGPLVWPWGVWYS